MNTTDKILLGLSCHARSVCGECPYEDELDCSSQMAADAEKMLQAAVKDIKSVVASNYYSGKFCDYCKYNEPNGKCHHHCIPYSSEWGWQWRGVEDR